MDPNNYKLKIIIKAYFCLNTRMPNDSTSIQIMIYSHKNSEREKNEGNLIKLKPTLEPREVKAMGQQIM